MNDKQLFAMLKKTSPFEDLRFFQRHAMVSWDLRMALEALQAAAFTDAGKLTIKRPEFFRRFTALQDRWRQEVNERDARARATEQEAA